jgi:hypothetical protein
MMAFDRSCHPNPEAFLVWKKEGNTSCPLKTSCIERALMFDEDRTLYNHSLAAPSVWKLWTMIATEFGIKI